MEANMCIVSLCGESRITRRTLKLEPANGRYKVKCDRTFSPSGLINCGKRCIAHEMSGTLGVMGTGIGTAA